MISIYYLSTDKTFSYSITKKKIKWRFYLRNESIKEISKKLDDCDVNELINYFNQKYKFNKCSYVEFLTLNTLNYEKF